MIKKILIFYFLIFVTNLLYPSSSPEQYLAVVAQDYIQFKGITSGQKEIFFRAISSDDVTIVNDAFDSAIVDENAYEFTKAAIVVHNRLFFDHFLSKLSPAKVQTKNDLQYSLLHVAAEVGNAHAVKELLKKGLSATDKITSTGQNPLHIAYRYGDIVCEPFDPEIIRSLIARNPDLIDQVDGSGKTALHWAVIENNLAMVQELLNRGANSVIKDENGYIALEYAILNRNTDVAEKLLGFVSCAKGKKNILKLISGPQYDSKLILKPQFSSEYLNQMLLSNVQADATAPIVELLLKNGADRKVTCPNGCTPLHYAVSFNNLKTVKLLLAAGADVTVADKDGNTPLHIAAQKGHIEIVKLLLPLHADINSIDIDGDTFLAEAVFNGHVEIVKLLLGVGANPNKANKKGNSSLHIAVIKRNIEIVKLLIAAGSDTSVANNQGFIPLYLAKSQEHQYSEIVTILENNTSYRAQCVMQ